MDLDAHCDRHPRYLAVQIVDCGRFHRLCVSCVNAMKEKGENLCPICHQKNQEAAEGAVNVGELVEKIGGTSKLVCVNFSKKQDIVLFIISDKVRLKKTYAVGVEFGGHRLYGPNEDLQNASNFKGNRMPIRERIAQIFGREK